MQQIINFFTKHKVFLLFLLLFSISIYLTIQSHSYHKSKFINSANFLSGGLYSYTNGIGNYFSLKSQNELLVEENNRLKTILYNSEIKQDSSTLNSVKLDSNYKFIPAKISKNSYALPNNVILINKGKRDNIKQDFGVITQNGILGIVDQVSNKFATVISVLNTTSRISALHKNSNYYGSLTWNAESPEIVQLTDISKTATIKIGDTIITSGNSSIFPKGIPIGKIKNFNLNEIENMFSIQVELFNDMTNLEYVYIIENKNSAEITNLLQPTNE